MGNHVAVRVRQANATTAKKAGKREFRHPSGNGITAASVRAGGPPTETLTRSGLPRAIAFRMMHADAAMNLIVHADLAIGVDIRLPESCTRYMPRLECRQPG